MRFGKVFSRGFVTKVDILSVLRQRGLLQQVSQPESILIEKLSNGAQMKLYCGADPTAKSLHLGNLLPLMVMLNFYVRGHDVVALIGGATGKVGDPSGRKTERAALSEETRLKNIARIENQFKRFFENGAKYYESRSGKTNSCGKFLNRNNHTWWKDVKMLDFLAQFGSSIRIQNMLSRDSVSSRLQGQGGLGFNEFTYQILQAYDFYHLYKEEQVSIQVGGNDQWGNITAGVDLINRILPEDVKSRPAYGLTVPLLTTASGEKFGKSAGNAVFIDPEISSSYELYQFFINTLDADVEKLLKMFTLLPVEKISEIIQEHYKSPQARYAQHVLAIEAVDMIHGLGKGKDACNVSKVLFGDLSENLSGSELVRLFENMRILKKASKSSTLVDLVCELSNCSKSEYRRKLKQGCIYLGPKKIKIETEVSDLSPFLIDNEVLLLRIGKQMCFVIKIE